MNEIIPNLWFNNCAKEAVEYYISVFSDGKILNNDYYTDSAEDITGHKKGEIITIEFKIMDTHFIAINAGAEFVFNPSVSFMVQCDNQEEIDYYWHALSFDKCAEQCGWVKDKYGISWQIVPKVLKEMLSNGTDEQRKNVTDAFMQMKKLDIEKLKKAYNKTANGMDCHH
jgi:predicted 3-demethylubiquinone-9 3-methyltransferase (glyoxalase superfamily)